MRINGKQKLALAAGYLVLLGVSVLGQLSLQSASIEDNMAARDTLSREVAQQGWIAFSAKVERGDWDLFIMRPDGSSRRKLTDTPDFNEAGIRFSPDGQRILYYRLPKKDPVANNTYGRYDMIIADNNGQNPINYGSDFPWASWGPTGSQISFLTPKGIHIADLATRKVVRQLPRNGIVQQLVWSPDGRWFLGTANGLGPYWNIGRLNIDTGEINAVSEVERYNCTPDWAPNSKEIVYARGIIPEVGGRAELWLASGDGQQKQMLYAEGEQHIYGACMSPNGQYLLFTRSSNDMGDKDSSQAMLALIRRNDTPMIGGQSAVLNKRYPEAKPGPRLDLGQGWEPCWTVADVPVPK